MDDISKRFEVIEAENQKLKLENSQLREQLINNITNTSMPPSKSTKKKKNNNKLSSGKKSGGQTSKKNIIEESYCHAVKDLLKWDQGFGPTT